MNHYQHLSILERESIQEMKLTGHTLSEISCALGRNRSTIFRELKRNSKWGGEQYSPHLAQKKYEARRKLCKREFILSDAKKQEKVIELFTERQWSPEQIAHRLADEGSFKISYGTIYRALHTGLMEKPGTYRKNNKYPLEKKLRRRGRKLKKANETRGKIPISHRIDERPLSANKRSRFGHWEADTVCGKKGTSCIVTLVDRRSRYLLACKCPLQSKTYVSEAMIKLLSPFVGTKLRSITPDRGKEFSSHNRVTQDLSGVQFYFADPHSPWQRGTNENTNGLLREYLPKRTCFDPFSDKQIAAFVDKLNFRPRKCLNWKSPFEVFFHKVLHLT